MIDITNDISLDTVVRIQLNPTPAFYLIDLSYTTDKQQNTILKFIEEPVKSAFILLLCENTASVLPTVLSRCVVYNFAAYTEEELVTFIQNKDYAQKYLSVCHTPGQIKAISDKQLDELLVLCDKIVNKMHVANISNSLSIVNKINYKDEYDKYNLTIFLNALREAAYNEFVKSNNQKALIIFNETKATMEKLRDTRLNQETLMEYFITKIWSAVRQ